MEKKIVILGAGPTGLGAAYRLNKLEYKKWEVHERYSYVGGLSASFSDNKGFMWDIGGHIIFSSFDRFNSFVEDMIGDKRIFHQRESWVWLMDRFIKYPFQNNFHFLREDVVIECVMGLIESAKKPEVFSNFLEWIVVRFGSGIAKYFMAPYNKKVWAVPLDQMDYHWIAERVSVIDLKRIIGNIIRREWDSDWGPNNKFSFPLYGGTGGLFSPMTTRIKTHLYLNHNAVQINCEEKWIKFSNGSETNYDILINTIPIDDLLGIIHNLPHEILQTREQILSNGGFMIGVGLKKKSPSNKNWIYFPENNNPFYRVTYLSNYSPNMTPGPDYYSLLCESSFSQYERRSKSTIVEETIQGLINTKFLSERDRDFIESTYMIEINHSLPVPFKGRGKILDLIQNYLESKGIYSRGRFGGWKYEVGNMDHAVVQGQEVVDKILTGKKETVYIRSEN